MNDTCTAFELPCGYFMYLVEHKYEEHWQKVTLFESKEKLGWELSSPPCLLYCHLSLNTNVWQCFGTQNLTSHILSTETSGILVFSGSQISLLLQAGGLGRLTKTRILGLKWSQRAKRSCCKWWKTRSYIWRRNTYATTVLHQYTKLLQWLKIWDKRCIANLWVSIFSFCWDSTLGWAAACKQHCKSLFVNFSFLFISWVHTSVAKLQGSFESSNCWIYFVWIYCWIYRVFFFSLVPP